MRSAALLMILAVLCSACGQRGGPVAITEVRESGGEGAPARKLSSAERFGIGGSGDPHAGLNLAATGPASSARHRFGWQAPDGWQLAPARPLREVTFTMGPSGSTECYVSVLSGAAGGVEANVNRWREQMGRPPLQPAEFADLPTLTVLGEPAPFIEIRGDYTGLVGPTMPGYMMRALVCSLETEVVFVKMVGPEAEVETERDNFASFCESLQQVSQ